MANKCKHQWESYSIAQHKGRWPLVLNDLQLIICWACGLVKLIGFGGVGQSKTLYLRTREEWDT